jgi:2-keto-4-pentenoate hydratase/2-oxohepta-3-ene-1,7-dioic acid hydratase in catechol pathway
VRGHPGSPRGLVQHVDLHAPTIWVSTSSTDDGRQARPTAGDGIRCRWSSLSRPFEPPGGGWDEVARLDPVRIARFTTGEDPQYGVVTGEVDQFGQPDENSVVVALAGDPLYVGIKLLEQEHRLADVRLLAPVLPRSKVVGIGRNYAAHAAELGHDLPTEPLMFLKPNTSVVGPGDPIFYPPQTSNLHYEGELAVVIGRICRDVPAEQATDVIHGYTIANDVTARDLQKSDVQFTRAKGFDSFCPLGPWIETDLDPQTFADGVKIQTYLNGDIVQDGTTSDLIFDIPTLIAHVSSVMTLLPGDVILTGTPEGVGPMNVGDEVEISIAGLGTLTNKVAQR